METENVTDRSNNISVSTGLQNVMDHYGTDQKAIQHNENMVLCQKLNLGETYYYQTVKLGTQSKRYEQNYSQMILAI